MSDCTICSNVIDQKNKTRLECEHEFCTQCIEQWFESKKSCPVCRKDSNMFPDIRASGVRYTDLEFDSNQFRDTDNNSDSDMLITDSSESDFINELMHDSDDPHYNYDNLIYDNVYHKQNITDNEFEGLIEELNLQMSETHI
jgi:hypothetical protein